MYWIPLLAGILNAAFILDLVATLSTGESLGSLLSDATGNSVASAIIDRIPTDPTVFWLMAGFILFFVCALECLVIYIAFYSDVSECRQCMEASGFLRSTASVANGYADAANRNANTVNRNANTANRSTGNSNNEWNSNRGIGNGNRSTGNSNNGWNGSRTTENGNGRWNENDGWNGGRI